MCSRSIYTRPGVSGDQDVDLDSETDLIRLIASVPWSLAYANLISTFTATLEVGPVPSTPQVECRASTMTCRLQDPQNASHTHDNLTIRPPPSLLSQPSDPNPRSLPSLARNCVHIRQISTNQDYTQKLTCLLAGADDWWATGSAGRFRGLSISSSDSPVSGNSR